MADQVLYSGVACITDLMVKEGLINLDFADVRSVMREMGRAMMGTGEASGEGRAMQAAEAAIANPLLDETSMKGAQGLLISITGGRDLTLFEVDEAATRIREEVDPDANIILGATFDESLEGIIRVSVVATGIDRAMERWRRRSRRSEPAVSRLSVPPRPLLPAPAAASLPHEPVMQQPKVDPIAETIRGWKPSLSANSTFRLTPAAARSQHAGRIQEEPFRPQSRRSLQPRRKPSGHRSSGSGPAAGSGRSSRLRRRSCSSASSLPAADHPSGSRSQVRMPKVEDFPPVVQAEIDHRSQPRRRPPRKSVVRWAF